MWEKWLYDLTKSHFQAPETERSLVASLRLASHSGFFFSRIPDHSAANHGIDNFPICHEPPAGDIAVVQLDGIGMLLQLGSDFGKREFLIVPEEEQ